MKQANYKEIRRIFCLIGLLSLGLLGCARDYVTGKSSYNWYKLEDDVQLGQQVLGAQLQAFQGKRVPVDNKEDRFMLERLRKIVRNIAQVSHLPSLPYEVHLAEAPIVNAWCAPGGKVMVYSGLWDPKQGLVNKESDDEIAAVLAHEIAHATARHVTKTLTQNMTVSLAGNVIAGAIAAGGMAQGSNLFGQVFSAGYNIYAPSYSRKNESEADRIGLFYMAKAGYNPQAAIQVWRRAAQKRGGATSIFASHPASGERAKELEKYLPLALETYHHPERPYPPFLNPKALSKPESGKKSPQPKK